MSFLSTIADVGPVLGNYLFYAGTRILPAESGFQFITINTNSAGISITENRLASTVPYQVPSRENTDVKTPIDVSGGLITVGSTGVNFYHSPTVNRMAYKTANGTVFYLANSLDPSGISLTGGTGISYASIGETGIIAVRYSTVDMRITGANLLDTIQQIATGSAPRFGELYLRSSTGINGSIMNISKTGGGYMFTLTDGTIQTAISSNFATNCGLTNITNHDLFFGVDNKIQMTLKAGAGGTPTGTVNITTLEPSQYVKTNSVKDLISSPVIPSSDLSLTGGTGISYTVVAGTGYINMIYNNVNLTTTSSHINTIQDICITGIPQFGKVSVNTSVKPGKVSICDDNGVTMGATKYGLIQTESSSAEYSGQFQTHLAMVRSGGGSVVGIGEVKGSNKWGIGSLTNSTGPFIPNYFAFNVGGDNNVGIREQPNANYFIVMDGITRIKGTGNSTLVVTNSTEEVQGVLGCSVSQSGAFFATITNHDFGLATNNSAFQVVLKTSGALQINNLTANQYVKTDANKQLVSSVSVSAHDFSLTGGTGINYVIAGGTGYIHLKYNSTNLTMSSDHLNTVGAFFTSSVTGLTSVVMTGVSHQGNYTRTGNCVSIAGRVNFNGTGAQLFSFEPVLPISRAGGSTIFGTSTAIVGASNDQNNNGVGICQTSGNVLTFNLETRQLVSTINSGTNYSISYSAVYEAS